MRRAAVPIAFLASYTLIAPFGVAVMSSASGHSLAGLAPLVPAAARPALQIAAAVPSPDASLEQIASARPGTKAARALTAARTASPQAQTHTIAGGDSLWGIARQYGVPVESVAEANRLSVKSGLRVQKTIVVPPRESTPAPPKPAARPAGSSRPTVTHVVAAGETPWRIAAAYGVRVGDLMALNGLREGDVIKPGQRILVTDRPQRPRQPAAVPARPAAPGGEPRMADVSPLRNDDAFLWPARGVITSRFGVRRYRRHHDGVDLAAPHGTPIYATRDGVVSFSGWSNGYGQVVYIDHAGGLTTIYGHASELLVAAGQQVKRGQMIARVGCTGWCTGAHVHFEVRVNSNPVNPLQYLR